MESEVVHIAMLGISQGAGDDITAMKLAVEMATAAGHEVVAQSVITDVEAAIRVQLASWIIDANIDVIIVTMDTRSKAVSAALRPLIVERVPGLIEAARCENTFVIVLLPGASSVKAALQHRILARLDSRADNNLVGLMPRLKERTKADAIPAMRGREQTGKDAIPAPVDATAERTTSGAGVSIMPRPPARTAPAMAAQTVTAVTPAPADPRTLGDITATATTAAPAPAPERRPQGTGKHVVSRSPSPFDVQTTPIDLVAMMPSLPPGADAEIDLDKDIPVFLPDAPKAIAPERERSAPRTRPPTAPPPGRNRPTTAQVQVIPPPPATARTRPPTAPPGKRSPTIPPPPPADRSRPTTGSNRPATLAVAVVPPPRPRTPSAGVATPPPTPLTPPTPPTPNDPPKPPSEAAAKLAEVWSSPPESDAIPEQRKVLKLKLAKQPDPELSQAGARLSEMWSAQAVPTDDDDSVDPKPAVSQAYPAVAPSDTAELSEADVEEVSATSALAAKPAVVATPAASDSLAGAPSPIAALLSEPVAKKPAPREEPTFSSQSLVDSQVARRDSVERMAFPPQRKRKRGAVIALALVAVAGGGVFAYSKLSTQPAAVAHVAADAGTALAMQPADAAEALVVDDAAEAIAVDAPEVVAAVELDAGIVEPDPAPDPAPRTPPKQAPRTGTPDARAKADPRPPDPAPKPDPKPDPAPDPAPKQPAVAAGCDEVSCVMDNYARACCARYKPAGESFQPKKGTADELDKTMIRVGVSKVKPAVIACGEKASAKGTVKIAMVVGPDGKVRGATVADAPDAALGACVATAMKRATFQATTKGGTFTYPFVF